MEVLPEDVLAAVLRRLPPRGLAVARGVCREWRAIVDARCDLRTDLLPTMLGGIFVTTIDPEYPEFFVRPSMDRRIAGVLESYEGFDYYDIPRILDCCNGLLLLEETDRVLNPATRQWAHLPPYYPASAGSSSSSLSGGYYFKYLAFDPSVSPHYEVLAIKCPFDMLKFEGLSEWPPSVYMMGLYTATTGCWVERSFAREEGSTTTIARVGSLSWHAAYLNTSLYTYWGGDFIMRITFFNDKYKIIHLPTGTNEIGEYDKVYLGKSKNRIHLALVGDQLGLQVWFLDESGGKTEWIFKHGVKLQKLYNPKYYHKTDRPWILQYERYHHENNKDPALDNDLDWNSDEDNALDIGDMGAGKLIVQNVDVFGFHPYKEILFLCLSASRVVAYYFSSNASKIQDLGDFPINCHYTIDQGFIYTPCWNRGLFAES